MAALATYDCGTHKRSTFHDLPRELAHEVLGHVSGVTGGHEHALVSQLWGDFAAQSQRRALLLADRWEPKAPSLSRALIELEKFSSLVVLDVRLGPDVTNLDPALGRLPSLHSLKLSAPGVTSFPAELRVLKALTSIDLTLGNAQESIDRLVSCLTRLRRVKILCPGSLTCIPPGLASSKDHLTSLVIGRLKSHPGPKLVVHGQPLCSLTALKRLKLDNVSDEGLPDGVHGLVHLSSLSLRGSYTSLPDGLRSLPLTFLESIQTRGGSQLSTVVPQMKTLQKLCARVHKCPSFPVSLPRLRELDLTCASGVPSTLACMPLLRKLSLKLEPRQAEQPGHLLKGLRALEEFSLLWGQWDEYPAALPEDFFSDCLLLKKLHINGHLMSIPDSIGGLRSLQEITLHNTCISCLPSTMAALASLTSLRVISQQPVDLAPVAGIPLKILEANRFTPGQHSPLPSDAPCLQTMQELHVQWATLPRAMDALSNLRKLALYGAMKGEEQWLELCPLTLLQELDLTYTSGVSQLPECLSSLVGLRQLRVPPHLSHVPEAVVQLPCLSPEDRNGLAGVGLQYFVMRAGFTGPLEEVVSKFF